MQSGVQSSAEQTEGSEAGSGAPDTQSNTAALEPAQLHWTKG